MRRVFAPLFLLATNVCLMAAPTTPAPAPASGPKPSTKPADAKPTPKPDTPAEPKLAPAAPPVKPPPEDAYKQMEMLTRAMEMVRQNYVEESKITYEELVQGALEGMLARLDPHCEYMGKSLFEDMQREQRDTSEGIGITIALRQNMLTIITVREDGPAAAAGVLSGDQLVRINDVLTDSVGVAEAMQLLKGKSGDEVRLTVRRPGTKQFLDFKVKHEMLAETSVHDALLLSSKMTGDYKIGYMRISQFNAPTAGELATALDDLEAEGMQAFVLDLRNNPGGLVDSAVAVCGEFLPEGTVVVTTEGRVASQNPPPYRTPSRNGKEPRKYPIAVLINHGSASASELTAGALQDLKRAIVVGTTSFGKGSVQTILPMKNGAAMRLTTAKYYTPSHRTIHENGVEPNIVSALTTEEEMRISKWRASHGTGEAAALELAGLGDKQLERAVDALKGVLVFDAFVAPGLAPAAKPLEVKP
ncbi:MAG: S41 family peptidase [Prosthecobacter sp.]|uniref:S41 family peptidase n=1 Tax=Prosthecobacter sp. TaxID=1965333 RepID=UPI0019DDB6A0|nr:S41 family peptidase [Prosthecobacter sp.]MBE2282930.1 S41 family peptidase [Prosthecobacter sp.]